MFTRRRTRLSLGAGRADELHRFFGEMSWGAGARHVPNAQFLGVSRPRLQPGDVFAMELGATNWLFGRVIRVDLRAPEAPMPSSNLVYLFSARAATPDPDRAELRPDRLLVPPTFTNRQGWLKGYWRTVARWPLEPRDVRSRHCFWDPTRHMYRDDKGERLPGRLEMCGAWGLTSFRSIDDEVSDAIGLPRAPLTSSDIARR